MQLTSPQPLKANLIAEEAVEVVTGAEEVIGAAGGTGESRNETQSGKSELSRFVGFPRQSRVERR